jgi:xanthine dehydrogenase accessory factor
VSFDWLAVLTAVRDRPHVLVTVVGVTGSVPRGVGTRMIVDHAGQRHGTLGGGNLERLVLELAREQLGRAGMSRERYPLGARAGQCCGGSVEVLVESVVPAPRLVLFGAGHVGQAVVRVLAPTRFAVTVVEERPEWIAALPEGTEVYELGWDLFMEQHAWGPGTYVAIMTHSHAVDREVLYAVLGVQTEYVGLIGSVTKWRRFREDLGALGVAAADLDRVNCPIGLGRWGKEPGDIAVSLAAELTKRAHEVEQARVG